MSKRVSLRQLNEREVRRQREEDEATIRDWNSAPGWPWCLPCDQHDEYEEFDLEAEFRDPEHDYEREIQEGFARDRLNHLEDRYASNPYNDGPERDPDHDEWFHDEYIRPHDDHGDELNLGASYEWDEAYYAYLECLEDHPAQMIKSYRDWWANVHGVAVTEDESQPTL